MIEVVLIRPAYLFPKNQARGNFGGPPLGLAYLAAGLKNAGHNVSCIDCFGLGIEKLSRLEKTDFLIQGISIEETIERIPKSTSVIGVSCMFSNEWIYCTRLIKKIHEARSDIKIILGGEHATADYENCFLDNPEIFAVVCGEGEETLVEIINSIKQEQDMSHISGVVFKKNGVVIKNPPRKRIKNLDQIAWPDWSTIPLKNYFDHRISNGQSGKKAMPLLASRGCPYKCTFCSNNSMWGVNWYVRSAADVVAEIENYKNLYGIEHFDFLDLTLVIRESWILEFTEKLIEKKLNLTWAMPTGTRSEALTYKALDLLKKSGCIKISYAPETGSVESLKRIKKNVDLKHMTESMKNAVKLSIVTRAHFIIGLPDDNFKDMFQTFLFILKLALIGVNDAVCFSFSPYPGSELYKKLLSEGEIKRNSDAYNHDIALNIANSKQTKSWNKNFSTLESSLIILFFHIAFYSLQFTTRPWRLFISFYRVFSSGAITTLEIVAVNKMSRLSHHLLYRSSHLS